MRAYLRVKRKGSLSDSARDVTNWYAIVRTRKLALINYLLKFF